MKEKRGLRVSLITIDLDGECWRILGFEIGLLYIGLFLVVKEVNGK